MEKAKFEEIQKRHKEWEHCDPFVWLDIYGHLCAARAIELFKEGKVENIIEIEYDIRFIHTILSKNLTRREKNDDY